MSDDAQDVGAVGQQVTLTGDEAGITATSGQIPANPKIPCHECGSEERFMTMKRSDNWELEHLDDGSGQWVAYCPECDPDE